MSTASTTGDKAWHRSSQQFSGANSRNNPRDDSRSRDNNMVRKPTQPLTSTQPPSSASSAWKQGAGPVKGGALTPRNAASVSSSGGLGVEKKPNDARSVSPQQPAHSIGEDVRRMFDEEARKVGAVEVLKVGGGNDGKGTKMGMMASGQNFFVELGKQILNFESKGG